MATDSENTPKLDLKELLGYERSDPDYFRDPMVDRLIEIVLLLGAEVWTNRNRQYIVEYLLSTGAAVTAEAVEAFVPDDGFNAWLQTERKALVRRVYEPLYGKDFAEEKGNFFDWL